MVKGVGAVRMRQLLDFFGSAEIAWNAPAEGLKSAGLPNKVVENFILMRDKVDLERVMGTLETREISVLTIEDADYPTAA